MPAVPAFLRFRLLAIVLLSALSPGGSPAALNVVASIRPLQAIAADIMQGTGVPRLLIDGASSPHDFQLLPSQAQGIAHADLLIWVGPAMESQLTQTLQHLTDQRQRLTLLDEALPVRLDYPADGSNRHGPPTDPHVWLDADNGIAIAGLIAARLAALDAGNAALYRKNSERLVNDIRRADEAIRSRLVGAGKLNYLLLHNGLRYFENRYSLQSTGALTVADHRPPGARSVLRFKQLIDSQSAGCLLYDPFTSVKLRDMLTASAPVKAVLLDLLGTKPKSEQDASGGYPQLLSGVADALAGCVAAPSHSPM